MKVIVQNDNVEKAIRKLRTKLNDSNLFKELQSREAYEKPTVTRRRAASAAKNRWQKQLKQQELPKKLF